MVRAIDRELALRHAGGRLVRHDDALHRHGAFFGAVAIEHSVVFLHHGLEILVDVVGAARGVHPAGALVEALVDEELSPGDGAVGVQAFLAHHLRFLAEEERRVGVDPQHRLAARGPRRPHGKAVRAGWFGRHRHRGNLEFSHLLLCRAAIERLELGQRHPLDVTADAALAEAERHPWFELLNRSRLRLGMGVKVVVQAVGPGVHQLLQPVGAGLVLRLQIVRVDEQLHAEVAPDLGLAFRLGQSAHAVHEVRFDAIEVVFGLRVDHAEHRVRVGLAVDVWHTPVVTDDGDALGALLPGGHLRIHRGRGLRRAARRADDQGEQKDELLHAGIVPQVRCHLR